MCQQDAIHGEVVCTCDRGWVGQFCDTRPIDVRIRGPLVQSVRPGETVKFNCGAKPQIKIEVRVVQILRCLYRILFILKGSNEFPVES